MSSAPLNLFENARLIRVTPDECDADIHQQLVMRGDRVHDLPSIEDLLTFRISLENFSRQCFALVQEEADGLRDVVAAIYTDWTSADTEQESAAFLRGNIREILTTPAELLQDPENLITCYSISSFKRGSGPALIKRLYSHFKEVAENPPVVSTLSPIRSLGAFVKAAPYADTTDPEELRLCAAAHLLQRTNETQNFHQPNGAYIGYIHVFGNATGIKDNVNGYDVMVGYRYPRDVEKLIANQQDWANGIIPASHKVRELMEQAQDLALV